MVDRHSEADYEPAHESPRQLRGFAWILYPMLLGSALLGLASGGELGVLQNEAAVLFGMLIGAVAGAIVGSLIWAFFPYESDGGT